MIKTRIDPDATRPVAMDGVKDVSMRVLLGGEHGMPNFSLRHFVVQPGGHTPRHSHDYEHEVVIISGRGEAEQAGETVTIEKGDVMYVAAESLHQFRNPGPGTLEMLCLVPRERNNGGEVPGS